jgi:hypothetical protein
LFEHLRLVVDAGHRELFVSEEERGDRTVSHADVESAQATLASLGEGAHGGEDDLVHLGDERAGVPP